MNTRPPSRHRQGRGAADNPKNRFEKTERIPDTEEAIAQPAPGTQFLADHSRSIMATNDSPDVGFDASINPYRGCEHGCIYCYARPTHEYLGFSSGLDFETRILVKHEAPQLLRKALSSPRWIPRVVALSGVTDPFQPIERRLQLTRRCLAVLTEFRNPVAIITKNFLVTRDADYLSDLPRHRAVAVYLSITTLDPDLCARLEPRTSRPAKRLAAIHQLTERGIPTGVMVAPVIPGLTDAEMPAILKSAAAAGARFAAKTPLRLPHAVGPLFENWLESHYPDRKNKILNRIRAIRGGRLNDPNFGSRMEGSGIFAEQISKLFEIACKKAGLSREGPALSTAHFRRAEGSQINLF